MNLQLWTTSNLGKVPLSLQREVRFYAPLLDSLDFMGVEPASFVRGFPSVAQRRDGLLHDCGIDVPRFVYSGETPLGVAMAAGEGLQFAAANALDDSSTLIWFEDGVPKSTPVDTNPFSSQGQWSGNLDNVHIKHVCKLNRILANSEINAIQLALGDVVQVIPPPLPPPQFFGQFIMETPSGARNGSNVTFTLSQAPDLNSLILVCFGIILERVNTAPGPMQFLLSGFENRTITMGIGPTTAYPFFAQFLSGSSP